MILRASLAASVLQPVARLIFLKELYHEFNITSHWCPIILIHFISTDEA